MEAKGASLTGETSGGSRRQEVEIKLQRLRSLLDERDLDAIMLSRQLLVSWLTGGLQSAIIRGTDPGFVRALVTRDDAFIVTQNIEGARLEVEDPPGDLGLELIQLPWHETTPEEFALAHTVEGRLGNDGFGPGRSVEDGLLAARLPLLEIEHDRLRSLALDATGVLETSMREIVPGTGERELAGELVRRLELVGIFPSVLLVGADQRRRAFRHPTVDGASIERDVLGVLCVQRDGLYVAVSRSVALGDADPELLERHRIACTVEAELILATVPGVSYEEALDAGVTAYERMGYPGEWKHHYQGGPIGYNTREAPVAPASATPGGPRLTDRRRPSLCLEPDRPRGQVRGHFHGLRRWLRDDH